MTAMTKKPIVAVDIDDVLAANAKAFVDYTNKKWGTSLTIDDYDEHWAKVWKTDLVETVRRADEMHDVGHFGRHEHSTEAKPVLEKLSEKYDLMVVTARRKSIEAETLAWLDKNYKDVFKNVHFAGIWDTITDGSIHMTKADVLKDVGASYLIDDQLKHCLAANKTGVKTILFGDYSWNQSDNLPKSIVRCHSWTDVLEYFDGVD